MTTSETVEVITPKVSVQIVQDLNIEQRPLVVEEQQKNFKIEPLYILTDIVSVAESLQIYDDKLRVHFNLKTAVDR